MKVRKKINTKKLSIIVVVLLAIVITIFSSSYVIFNELETQLLQNLEDVAAQNVQTLYHKIHSHHELLMSLSEDLQDVTKENVEEKLQSYKVFLDKYNLKRFAYVFPDGTSYSTDGSMADLSYRRFFMRGMEGKGSLTCNLKDALDGSGEPVNVMTIPILNDKGKAKGVFGLTYYVKDFNDALQIDCFNGKGYSCVINEEGDIVVAMGSDTVQLSQNMFTDVLGTDNQNAEAIENLQKKMKGKNSDNGEFYLDEKSYYYSAPVSLMDGDVTWYMLTIVPSDVLKSRATPIQKSLYMMAFIVVVLIVLGVMFIIYLSREQKKMMFRHAYEDPLTKGPNYARFCVEMNKKRDPHGYLISMDITHFNNINIAAGQMVGAQMLGDIWKIMTRELQNEELAAHVQEDIFCMYLKADDEEMLKERLKRISNRINKKAKELQVKGIHARYGVYEMTGKEDNDDSFSKAQIAREQARSHHDQLYVFYDEMDHEQLLQNQQLEDRFEESLADGDFEVWYQPKYSVETGKIVGSEALVRWRDTDGSLISPGVFIPLFEQNGMIAKLDEYVFRAVCKQQARWASKGQKIHPVSINLSRASLYYVDVIERYRTIMQDYKVNPSFIQLEITESALEGTSSIRDFLEQFRAMGIQILMDDFGTGYSSLATLNMQCFDTLKLDKSLIDHIGDKNGDTLLYYVINMGKKLGLHITAEGVENSMQLKFLKENHCDDIQGFLFAKPMPSNEFEDMLDDER